MARWLRLLVAVTMALVVCVAAAGPAAAAKGGNSDNAKRCQKGGWQSLFDATGERFVNQGDCVSYGAQGGTLYTSAGQAVCQTFGGTFIPDGGEGTLLWQCNGYSYPAGATPARQRLHDRRRRGLHQPRPRRSCRRHLPAKRLNEGFTARMISSVSMPGAR